MAIDGDYAQHLANGGCPSLHHNGRWFCHGEVGHYSWPDNRHWTKVLKFSRGGAPLEALHVEWN